MKSFTLIFTSILFLILLAGCYTVMKKVKTEQYAYYDITGSWMQESSILEPKVRDKIITFNSNGAFNYYPDAYYPDNYLGKFTVSNDTVRILLYDNFYEQVFIYDIQDETLSLERIDSTYRMPIHFNDNKNNLWYRM